MHLWFTRSSLGTFVNIFLSHLGISNKVAVLPVCRTSVYLAKKRKKKKNQNNIMRSSLCELRFGDNMI
jgi:hypothetical protein